ncbi:MAG: sialate O-acetylesterase [Planctomycetota bacterium]|nr:sialate O-acetylesterase [Planctomycetota bacterium]
MRISIVALAVLLVSAAHAEVSLPAVFSDHMVLQADQAVPVFGAASAGETVNVSINGQKKTATAGADGKWSVKLDAMKPGGPYELVVGSRTIKDVLVGEVWVAGGQSNMKYPLNRATTGPADAAKAEYPQFRFFSVERGQWSACTPQACPRWSAVAFYFAVHLNEKLKRPVGILENAVSGAVAQTFANPKLFEENKEVAELIKQHKIEDQQPSMHYKTLVEPIVGYGIKGWIWYQGEGNRDFPVTYAKLLPAIVADWRKSWGQGDFAFLIVQLANWGQHKPEPWEGKDCALREAQLKISQTMANSALAVTIDLGIPNDVHYPNKKPVGERLAVAARGAVYGEKIESSGPLFASASFDGGKATVSFTHVGAGLTAEGGTIKGFLLGGADKKFVHADAKIEGDKVVVTSAQVPAPVSVRYGWERNPECNLANKDGLPASPFRSDDFKNYWTTDGD